MSHDDSCGVVYRRERAFRLLGRLAKTGCLAPIRRGEKMQSIRDVTCLLTAACVLVVAVGTVAAQDKEAGIRANLAKLPEKDRKLAEAQKWCAVDTDDRLVLQR
jgi:hypothetical protein